MSTAEAKTKRTKKTKVDRYTLEQCVASNASLFRRGFTIFPSNDTGINALIAERLEQLAAEIRATDATTVAQFRERHDAMLSEHKTHPSLGTY